MQPRYQQYQLGVSGGPLMVSQCDWPSKQLSICVPLSRLLSVTQYCHAGQIEIAFCALAFVICWRALSLK